LRKRKIRPATGGFILVCNSIYATSAAGGALPPFSFVDFVDPFAAAFGARRQRGKPAASAADGFELLIRQFDAFLFGEAKSSSGFSQRLAFWICSSLRPFSRSFLIMVTSFVVSMVSGFRSQKRHKVNSIRISEESQVFIFR
jgi:hypothetical protein